MFGCDNISYKPLLILPGCDCISDNKPLIILLSGRLGNLNLCGCTSDPMVYAVDCMANGFCRFGREVLLILDICLQTHTSLTFGAIGGKRTVNERKSIFLTI